nr:hypothetical protein [Tanacetum cinerariifolium]
MPGPGHPSSPNYMPGPEYPPSPVEIPYVPEAEYPEYLEPYDDEAPLEDQPLPAAASPTIASPGYVANSDLDEDLEEDPGDDHADYFTDGGDGDDKPFDNNDDDDTDDEEPFEDEEHLASADSSVAPIVDHVLPDGDTKALEADEPAPTPRSPHTIIPLSDTCLRTARKTVRLEPSMSTSIEACIARYVALLSPPLPIPSPPIPFPSLLTTSLTNTEAPLGYKQADIRMRALLPSTSRMTDIPDADVAPRKRAYLTTPTPGFKVEKRSVDGAARQPGPTESDLRRYMIKDRPDHCPTTMLLDREAMYAREAWTCSKDRSTAIATHVRTLEAQKMAPKKRTTRATPATTTTPTTTVTDAQLQALIDRGIAAALAERDADRSRNGDTTMIQEQAGEGQ